MKYLIVGLVLLAGCSTYHYSLTTSSRVSDVQLSESYGLTQRKPITEKDVLDLLTKAVGQMGQRSQTQRRPQAAPAY